jgi:hypothetical protein
MPSERALSEGFARHLPPSVLRNLAAGALGGAAATLAMSPLLSPRATRRIQDAIPPAKALPEFPPRRVIQVVEERLTGARPLGRAEPAITWAAHVGYGIAMGALFGALHARRSLAPGMSGGAAGVLFGLGVWAAGYLGWLPLLGVRDGTARGDRRDLPFPLAAHIVYGATTGAFHGRLSRTPGS